MIAKEFISQLDGVSELLVVTDKQLAALPFAVLARGESVARQSPSLLFSEYREIDWLINSFAITQLPSINTLREINYVVEDLQKPDRRAFTGFGDPVFNEEQLVQHMKTETSISMRSTQQRLRGLKSKKNNSGNVTGLETGLEPTPFAFSVALGLKDLPELSDTREEIETIASALNADTDRDVFVGLRASEENVFNTELKKYKTISFATHGLIPGDLEGLFEPALALSNPKLSEDGGDGLLTATEILGLDISADLVVLSACNTAAAEGEGAEAVSGLGRSFFYAGAKSILVSNWPVHSLATNALMKTLFARLSGDDMSSRTEALRQAQLKMISELGFIQDDQMAFSYAHPIFWAPFTLVGNGG